jgi:hypothetical protein
MSLIYCPECGHEISNSAVACPNCGRPINAEPAVERKVVVAHHRPRGVPTWAIATVGIMGVLVLFLIFFLFTRGSSDDEANTRLRVNMNAQHGSTSNRDTVASTSEPSTVTSVPAGPSSVSVPSTSVPTTNMPSTETPVSGAQVQLPEQPTKGTAIIQAKVITKNNSQQPVRGQRFYLLDKDVEQILSDAHVDPIEGNTLTASMGLAAAMPDQYGDFQRRAMQAIKGHIKYAGTTDSNGKAQLGNINPDSYYLFGVVRSGNGFAIWSSPVSINAGENVLDLAPQSITEINRSSGEE